MQISSTKEIDIDPKGSEPTSDVQTMSKDVAAAI